ncbi:MAG TPA: sodium-independent anion transporter [Ignavibacteriales bacterium]|nr:sodium-independent anion transporter [Ignavibacteriales bacterium]
MSQVTNVGIISKELEDIEEYDPAPIESKHVPEGVEVFEINGPFFFGAVDKFKETIANMENKPKVRIIRMRHVNAIDSTGLHTLEELHKDCKKENIKLLISGIHAQPLKAMTDSGLYDIIGEENFVGNIDEALEKANEYLKSLNK